MVAAFRAARIKQRPALHTELRNDHVARRHQRLAGLSGLKAIAASPTRETSMLGEAVAQIAAKEAPTPVAASMFAQLIGDAQEAESVPEAPIVTNVAVESSIFTNVAVTIEAVEMVLPGSLADESPAVAQEAIATPIESHEAAPARDDLSALPDSKPPGPALSSIGFGPGMVLRFKQLGILTSSELAAADALGDISRLINVDVWIATAMRACADAAQEIGHAPGVPKLR
jgi:hypothetical protein